MGYRITYGQTLRKTNLPTNQKKTTMKKWIYFALVCVLLVFALSFGTVRRYLLPGDPVVTERALRELVSDLRTGEKVSDAVTAFCREILDNA